jgi:hypothetical protein
MKKVSRMVFKYIKRIIKYFIARLPYRYRCKLLHALLRKSLGMLTDPELNKQVLSSEAFLDPALTQALAQIFAQHLQRHHKYERTPYYNVFLECGFHLMADHYYHPQPKAEEVGGDYWQRVSELPGLTINGEAALALAEKDLRPFFGEFRSLFPLRETPDGRLPIINGAYMAVDGHLYYSLIRHLKPGKIIEIGAGCSTRMASPACLKNAEEGHAVDYTLIEPYPIPVIRAGVAGASRLLEKRLQEMPLDLFTALQAGDILFLDSSHVLRSGNDVQYAYLEILPRLNPGVYVHIHDISLPEDYPDVYYKAQLFWTEQYLLQAFLAFNGRFDIIWPGNYLMVHFAERMHALFPEIAEMRKEYPLSEPTAFWVRS